MVLDPLAAVSLVSSVFQLADFTLKIISNGKEFYKSNDGVLEEHNELQVIAKHFAGLSKGLKEAERTYTRLRPRNDEEIALQKVAVDCQKIAEDFSTALDELKVREPQNRWKSFRKALEVYWSKEKIESMLQRLQLARGDLVMHLLVFINNQQSSIKRSLLESNKETEKKILEAIQDSSSSLRQEISSLLVGIHSAPEKGRQTIGMLRVAHPDQVVQLSEKLSEMVAQERVQNNASRMIHSLYFAQMNERYAKVAVAHEKTFKWIFDNTSDPSVPGTKFVPWLKDRQDSVHLYWVTGKAGSGKSTLMRFLCDDRRTKHYLELWAAPHKLIFVSCFFWNPGDHVQRSLTGLLQSLLHQMLCQCRDLICIASPWRWQSYDLGAPNPGPWSIQELLEAFHKVIEGTKDSIKWFMLIDGLDEFEGDDKARTKINDLFKSITRYQHVKVCLSSRPWNIFEDAFEGFPRLRLESLTYNDIKEYVHAEVGGNHRFEVLSSKNPAGCSRLIATIIDKAAGVFLWVYLVTALLVTGIRDGDVIPELQQRLDQIPPDLEDYFKHMIGGLEANYLQQACHLFQIALKSNSLSLLTYSYTQEKDADYAIDIKSGCISEPDLDERLEWMERRLNSRCKGMLEIYTDPNHEHRFFNLQVDFSHRSVRDFLQTPFASTVLEKQTDESFDVDVELCKSYLTQLKTIQDSYNDDNFSMSRSLLADFLLRAREFEQKNGKPLCRLMDHLDQSFTLLWQQSGPSSASDANHWSDRILCNEIAHPYLKRTFLSFALAAGLHVYVRSKLESDPGLVRQKRGRPLLDCALRPSWFCEKKRLDAGISYKQDEPDVETVALIVAQGADPNQPFKDFTVWIYWLLDLHNRPPKIWPNTLQARLQVTHLLIKAGAFTKDKVNVGRNLTPLEILQSVFTEKDYEFLERAVAKHQNSSFGRPIANKTARMLNKYRAAR